MREIMNTIGEKLGIHKRIGETQHIIPVPDVEHSLLPFDVRYALQYRKGLMGREEISLLAQNPVYREAAFYLSVRALRNEPEQQRTHILRHVNALTSKEHDDDPVLHELLSSIQELPSDTQVDGSKLGEVSRQGPKLRAAAYEKIATNIKNTEGSPVLVAHAALEGLHTFLPMFPKLHVVSPHWFNREGFPIGYVISAEGRNDVTFLKDKSQLPSTPVFVDDTLNEGGTKNAVNDFMGAPIDFRVINTVKSAP